MSTFNEAPTVQNPLIKYVTEIGWSYLSRQEALHQRRGETGVFLRETLRVELLALNRGVVTPEDVDEVIARLEAARPSIEGNAEVLSWLRGECSIFVPTQKRQINVRLIDFVNLERNVFQVTDEWSYTNGRYTNRADVMFVINGIPVAIVETKSAKKADGIDLGVTQIWRYHDQTPELMTAPQVFDITHLIHFYYGVTWNTERKALFNWKDEAPGNASFEERVKRFFDRKRFLKLLGEWIIFYQKGDEWNKVVLRQHQTRAVEKVVARAADPAVRRGLIWHTQGSGKTFTMIKAADQILRHPDLDKPTLIMLIDRNELEGQLSGWIARVLGERAAEIATSKKRLRAFLASDYRGLIVSMIHKFDKADADLCTRDNVIVLVDEAHRTTGGDLGNYLVGALPNATLIGFTGTPIDRTAYGQGTFKVFGGDDPQGYLDKYSIAESIEDGTTLPLRYTLAPNDVRVPTELLEKEFFALAETEGISDIEELNRILDKAVNLTAFLKSKDRVEKVAQFVAQHFRENVEPLGYKAFVVGVDREACALYKAALDKFLPPEYSQPVYTSAHNDSEALAQHKLGEEKEKQIRKDFAKSDKPPKIFIVTEMLLTGYDAPILYCMYLDKPMRDHTLLQAIARVNRPYEADDGVRKPSGFVLDFVGIFDKLEKALEFDSDVVSGVIENVDVLKARFVALMTQTAPAYLDLAPRHADDKAIERVIEAFGDKDRREAFYQFFKELQTLYEILTPDASLRPYIDDYIRLSALYELAQSAFGRHVPLLKDLMRKTEALVRETVTSTGLVTTLPVYEINETTLAALREGNEPDEVKVINLVHSIRAASDDGGNVNPILISIGERADGIATAYEDRQTTTQQALEELERLVEERLQAEREQRERGFDINTFAIYWALKKADVADAAELAPALDAQFASFRNYLYSDTERRQLRIKLTAVLVKGGMKDRAAELVDQIMRLRRVATVAA